MPVTDLTDSQRYAAFLLANLHKLKACALHAPESDRVTRTTVLPTTIDVVADQPGLGLEFGVWRGRSINLCADAQPDRSWVGFDSFEGFPEDGRIDWQKPFKVVDLPEVPENVRLVKGYFSDTLPGFLEENEDPVAFVNIDCDIYSSTVDVFTALEAKGHLRPGLPIYFDELVNYADALWNEMLALFQMLERTGLGFRWLALDKNLWLPRETLEMIRDKTFPTWREQMGGSYWQQASLVLTEDGIDYGPLEDPDYLAEVTSLAALYDQVSELRVVRAEELRIQKAKEREEFEARRAVIMEERRQERLKLQKERQAANLAKRREEQARLRTEKQAASNG